MKRRIIRALLRMNAVGQVADYVVYHAVCDMEGVVK